MTYKYLHKLWSTLYSINSYTTEALHWSVTCFTDQSPSPVRCISDLKCSSLAPRLILRSNSKSADSSLSCNRYERQDTPLVNSYIMRIVCKGDRTNWRQQANHRLAIAWQRPYSGGQQSLRNENTFKAQKGTPL